MIHEEVRFNQRVLKHATSRYLTQCALNHWNNKKIFTNNTKQTESREGKPCRLKRCGKTEGFEATEEISALKIRQLAADYNMPVEQVLLFTTQMVKQHHSEESSERDLSTAK